MAGDDLRVVVYHAEHEVGCGYHAVDRATVLDIDEWVPPVEVGVPHVDHVGISKDDDRVAVRVCVLNVERVQLVAVQVERKRLGKCYHRKRNLWPGRVLGVEHLQYLRRAQSLPHVIVGNDDRPRLTQILVSTRVIPVPVSVDHEANRLVAKLPNRGEYLFCQRRVLVVY